MAIIKIKSMHIENFKGIKSLDVNLSDKTAIRGKNASGKTTIVDAFLWLLFGKNSQYVEKFDLRPLDADGNPIHFVDICVSSIIDFDGNEVELKKTQKEKWVKSRGAENAEFQGNVNTFEIDGYPKSDKEFKAFIADNVTEDLFKMLTSPTYFPNLKWKEQRDILMKFASNESDVELAERIGGFEDLIPELKKAPTTADIKKKYDGQLKELKAKQVELPTRIDEVSRQKVDIDVAELELAKADVERKLSELNAVSTEEFENLKQTLMETQFAVSAINNKIEMDLNERKRGFENKKFELETKIRKNNADLESLIYESNSNQRSIDNAKAELDKCGKEYFECDNRKFPIDEWTFDENSTVCKACGQNLPAERITTIKAEFEKRKALAEKEFDDKRQSEMKRLISVGNSRKSEINELTARNEKITQLIKDNSTTADNLKLELLNVNKDIDMINFNEELIKERETLIAKQTELENKVSKISDAQLDVSTRKVSLNTELARINGEISRIASNNAIDDRIDELKAEQKDVSIKIAGVEKMLYLLETFIRAKLDNVSAQINGKFKIVKWKLFETQINGGLVECCECTVNGVPYSSVNSASKIQAGLDIINTLSEVYGVVAPIFVDNRESVTDIPSTTAQIISLYVDASYKDLKVEEM